MRDIDFASYAGDNTPYLVREDIDEVVQLFENDSLTVFQRFKDNQTKSNKNKCH